MAAGESPETKIAGRFGAPLIIFAPPQPRSPGQDAPRQHRALAFPGFALPGGALLRCWLRCDTASITCSLPRSDRPGFSFSQGGLFSDINSDLARRDFTINAIAYNYTKGLVDPFEGIEDIGRKMIRCVGDPGKRFDEDALRIMRCIRFASELGFDIDSSTAYSAAVKKKLLHNISAERIRIEFNKLLCGEGATQVMRTYRDIVAEVVPEIRAAFDFDQRTPYHIYDVWEHTLRVLYHTEPDIKLKLIAFFHDLGKPEMFTIRNGRGHFYRHEKVSEEIARTVLARLKYDNDTIYHVCSVIRNHSIIFQRSAKQARRLLLKLGEEDLRMLIKLECADVKGQNPAFRDDRMALISDFSKILDMVIGASQCFSMRDMAINGNDLIDIGIRQGPEIGRILKKLLDMIIEEEINNDRDILLLKAREIAGKS